jgi:hypothetical protein
MLVFFEFRRRNWVWCDVRALGVGRWNWWGVLKTREKRRWSPLDVLLFQIHRLGEEEQEEEEKRERVSGWLSEWVR